MRNSFKNRNAKPPRLLLIQAGRGDKTPSVPLGARGRKEKSPLFQRWLSTRNSFSLFPLFQRGLGGFITLILLFSINQTFSQIPQLISYQRVLTDNAGNLVSDGNYNLTFNLYTVAVGGSSIWTETQSDTFTQNITGEGFNPQLEIMTDIIDFGVVEVGYENTIEQIAVLKNLSNQDIEITDVVQLGPDMHQFEILEGGGNFILGANSEHQMKLRFKPRFGGRTSGQIGFEYNSFASPAVAQLFGTGIGGEIEIDDYSGYPGEEINVAFRLTNINPEGLAELAKTFKAEVEVNGTLLYSRNGKVVNQEANFVSYEFEGNLGNSNILFNIPMKIGLGNSETSDIKLTKIELYDENGQIIDYDMEFNSGLFTLLGVCYEGGARLLDPNSTPVILSIHPNPTGDMINIEFELIEKGGGELMIIDYQGKSIYNTLLSDTPGKVSFEINSSGLPNGVYTVILKTPTINATQKLLINK